MTVMDQIADLTARLRARGQRIPRGGRMNRRRTRTPDQRLAHLRGLEIRGQPAPEEEMNVLNGNPANVFPQSPVADLPEVYTVYQQRIYQSKTHHDFYGTRIVNAASQSDGRLTCLDLEWWPLHRVWSYPEEEVPQANRSEYRTLLGEWRKLTDHATRVGIYGMLPRAGVNLSARRSLIDSEIELLKDELIPHVDVMMPAFYVRVDTTPREIMDRTRLEIQFHKDATNKPIYGFIHQRYHPSHIDATLRYKYIGDDNLRAQLDVMKDEGVYIVWWDYPLKTYYGEFVDDRPDPMTRGEYQRFYSILNRYR